MKKTTVIAIAGGSASGKTSISEILSQAFEKTHSVQIIRQDDYYNDQADMTFEQRLKTNYDHPLSFDNELFIKQIKTLCAGQAIEKPTYDFVQYTRSQITEHVLPCDVIILDGLFVLENDQIRQLSDMKIYVDTDADIRFIRRLKRDVQQRGRTLESVCDQYMKTVRVMHEAFVEPSKRYADIIIPEGAHNIVAVDLLLTKIRSLISAN
jgi:uridine kinase